MKKSKIILLIFLSFSKNIIAQIKPAAVTDGAERKRIAAIMERSLKDDLLGRWYPQCIDTDYGGFISTFTYQMKPTGSQDKMIVTQARHTWVNAKAALRYPDKPHYRRGAVIGFQFLADKMWDKQYGGFYELVARS